MDGMEQLVRAAKASRLAANTWELGKAQEAAALLAKLIEPSQCEGAAAPKHSSERRLLLEAAVLLDAPSQGAHVPAVRTPRPRNLAQRRPP